MLRNLFSLSLTIVSLHFLSGCGRNPYSATGVASGSATGTGPSSLMGNAINPVGSGAGSATSYGAGTGIPSSGTSGTATNSASTCTPSSGNVIFSTAVLDSVGSYFSIYKDNCGNQYITGSNSSATNYQLSQAISMTASVSDFNSLVAVVVTSQPYVSYNVFASTKSGTAYQFQLLVWTGQPWTAYSFFPETQFNSAYQNGDNLYVTGVAGNHVWNAGSGWN